MDDEANRLAEVSAHLAVPARAVDWIRRTPVPRAVRVTAIGRTELTRRLRLVFTAGQDVLYRSN